MLHRRVTQAVVAMMAGCFTVADASAQVCLGRPSLNVVSVNAGVRLDRRQNATGVGAAVAVGTDRAFGGFSASRLRYTEFDASASAFAAHVGWSVPPSIPTLFICPILQGAYGRGPNDNSAPSATRRSSLSALAGLAIAGQIALHSKLSLIPNVTGGVLYQRSTRTINATSAAASDVGSDFGGTVSAGVSLLLNDGIAIQPAVRLPIGFDDRDPVFSIGLTFGLGRRP